jgi:hypothetical protein
VVARLLSAGASDVYKLPIVPSRLEARSEKGSHPTPQHAPHATPLNCAFSRLVVVVSQSTARISTMKLQSPASPHQHLSCSTLNPTNAFTASWSPSKATALDTASLPITKAHRAWERAPQSPQAEHSRFKKVWKRYELRSGPDGTTREVVFEQLEPESEGLDSPTRVVKKLRIKSPRPHGGDKQADELSEKNHEPTRWDRRRRSLRRMS